MTLRPLGSSLEQWAPARSTLGDPLSAIAAAWASIVGADVAAHSAPLALAGTTLVVATRSSAWSQQLQFLSLPILEGLRRVAGAAAVDRIAFRAGAFRRARRAPGTAASPVPSRPRALAEAGPAVSLEDALQRLRRRIAAVRAAAARTCRGCGAPLETVDGDCCAPCRGALYEDRRTAVERLVYLAPWLTLEEIREQIPDLGPAEFERARRHLLRRWWLVLDRARRAGRLSASGIERHVASSYVLLQSRLPPDRITPAVVRNLLGLDLEALLWPAPLPGA